MAELTEMQWSKGDARADLRRELRARGLNPGGGPDALKQRLCDSLEHDRTFHTASSPEEQENTAPAPASASSEPHEKSSDPPAAGIATSHSRVARPAEGDTQNSNNLLPERNTSRIIQPPGGKSQIDWM